MVLLSKWKKCKPMVQIQSKRQIQKLQKQFFDILHQFYGSDNQKYGIEENTYIADTVTISENVKFGVWVKLSDCVCLVEYY